MPSWRPAWKEDGFDEIIQYNTSGCFARAYAVVAFDILSIGGRRFVPMKNELQDLITSRILQ